MCLLHYYDLLFQQQLSIGVIQKNTNIVDNSIKLLIYFYFNKSFILLINFIF